MKLYSCNSYLKNPEKTIIDISVMQRAPENFFVSIDRVPDDFLKKINPDYIEGAITVTYQNRRLITFEHYDLIDQFIVTTIEEVFDHAEGKTFFPDQPLQLKIKKLSNDTALVSLGDKDYMVSYEELIHSLLVGAQCFFSLMKKYFPEKEEYSHEYQRAIDLKAVFEKRTVA